MATKFGSLISRFAPLLAGILIVVEIILTNQLAGTGYQLRTIDTAIDALRSENATLEQNVASASSLAAIAGRAAEMGFVEPLRSQFLTVVSELPVAMSPR